MNKMNIPPPFEELENEFPMVKEAYCMENYQDIFEITKGMEIILQFLKTFLLVSVLFSY